MMSSNNPHNLTFPYPQIGNVNRPAGQGCIGCVHESYCPAVYWWKRNNLRDLELTTGRACSSWTQDPAQRVTTISEHDLEEVDYQFIQGIGSEANRNGINTPVTGGDRSVEG